MNATRFRLSPMRKTFCWMWLLLSFIGSRSSAQVTVSPRLKAVHLSINHGDDARVCWFGETFAIVATKGVSGTPQLFRMSLSNGFATPLAGLNDLLKGEVNRLMSLSDIHISPDGDWVIWRHLSSEDGGAVQCAMTDGTRSRVIEQAVPQYVAWETTPARALLFYRNDGGIPGFSSIEALALDSGKTTRILRPKRFSPLTGSNDGFGHVFMLCCSPLLGETINVVSRYPHLMPRSLRNGAGGEVAIAEIDLAKFPAEAPVHKFTLPMGSDLFEAVVSPDGKHVAWQLAFEHTTENLDF